MVLGRVTALGSALCVMSLSSAAGAAVVAQWNFDTATTSGTNIVVPDDSGNGHSLTYASANASFSPSTPYTPATPGDNSLSISHSYVSTPPANITNPGGINLTTNNAFTIQGWINPAALNASGTSNITFFSLTNGLASNAGGISLNLQMTTNTGTTANKLQFNLSYSNAGHNVYSANTLPTDAWTFVAVTYSGTTLTMYTGEAGSNTLTTLTGQTNGKNGTYTGASVVLPTFANGTNNNFIGQSTNNPTAATGAPILYDDFRISDTALSQTDISNSMQSFTAPVPEPASLSLLALGGLMMIRRRRKA